MPSPRSKMTPYQKRKKGISNDNKRVILKTEDLDIDGYISPDEEQVYTLSRDNREEVVRRETGSEVVAYLNGWDARNTALMRTLKINLTKMTEQELTATKEALDSLFATAYPIVKQRDEMAEEALDAGDSSFMRIYRKVPSLFVRAGEIYSDNQVVRSGSEWPTDIPTQARVLEQRTPRRSSRDLSEFNAGEQLSANNAKEDRIL